MVKKSTAEVFRGPKHGILEAPKENKYRDS